MKEFTAKLIIAGLGVLSVILFFPTVNLLGNMLMFSAAHFLGLI